MRKVGIWGGVLGAVVLSGCVSTSDIGMKNRQLTEEESPLVFNGPGLENGYRKFTYGKSPDHLVITLLADYGPKSGRYPSANIMLRKLTNSQWHFYKVNLQDELQKYTSFKENLPPLGEKQFYVNNLGRADYVPFQHAGEHCIFFVQTKGRGTGSLDGNTRVQGFYCDTKPISREAAVAALGSLDIRNNGRPIKIEKKDTAAKPSNQLVGSVKTDQFVLGWEGLIDERKVAITYRLVSEKKGVISFYTPDTGTCKGDFKLTDKISKPGAGIATKGNWNFKCHKGQVVSGWLKLFPKHEGKANIYGKGEDEKGQTVNFAS